jgi:hypothetical protein
MRKGEEEIWVAEVIAGHGIAVLVDFFEFSLVVSFRLFGVLVLVIFVVVFRL